jgi:hypothetical protein
MAHAITHTEPRAAAFSIASILAIVAALGSFMVGAGWGLLLAIAAIILGVIGIVVALLPGVRGGILSSFSVLVGVIGIAGAILRIIF